MSKIFRIDDIERFKNIQKPLTSKIKSQKITGNILNKGKSEAQIQAEICTHLNFNKIRFWVIDVKGQPRKTKTGFTLLKNKNRGFGDIMCCYYGKLIFLEVKIPGGLCSSDQLVKQIEVREAGGVYEFVTSVKEVDIIFKEITRMNNKG